MNKVQFEIDIKAPKEKVWDVMLGQETFRDWTDVFNPDGGSYYEGSWEEGSEIRFIGPDENGNVGGMIDRVVENKPYERVSLEIVGLIGEDREGIASQDTDHWIGGRESYTFSEENGVTHVLVELESKNPDDPMLEMFNESWPKALERVKQLAEPA